MNRYRHLLYALLLAGALLTGCDVSSPGGAATPAPAATAAPATTGAPESSPDGNATAYPVPVDTTPISPTFAPGYVPPTFAPGYVPPTPSQ